MTSETWLKLDIEGAEHEVIPALLQSEKTPVQVSLEVHDYHRRGAKLCQALASRGYEVNVVTDRSSEPFWAEIRATR